MVWQSLFNNSLCKNKNNLSDVGRGNMVWYVEIVTQHKAIHFFFLFYSLQELILFWWISLSHPSEDFWRKSLYHWCVKEQFVAWSVYHLSFYPRSVT